MAPLARTHQPSSIYLSGSEGTEPQAKIAEQMGIVGERMRASLVLALGDNFYRCAALPFSLFSRPFYGRGRLFLFINLNFISGDLLLGPHPEIFFTSESSGASAQAFY